MPQAHLLNPVYFLKTFEMDCFKTILPDHVADVFITETNKYAHQVISKYDKDYLPHSLEK
jgi:hypothetical protein